MFRVVGAHVGCEITKGAYVNLTVDLGFEGFEKDHEKPLNKNGWRHLVGEVGAGVSTSDTSRECRGCMEEHPTLHLRESESNVPRITKNVWRNQST